MTPSEPTYVDHCVPNYKRYPLTFTRGEGAHLFDASGRRWLDFLTGLGVNALGHAHPRLVAALRDQAGTLIHISNLYQHPLQNELATRLAEVCELDRVFFSNSGAEANETGLKMARLYQRQRGAGERTDFLALEKSFHGRSFGALSCTWQESYRAPFEPLVPGVRFVPAGDVDALERALRTGRFAALIVEPIQGESGVLVMSDAYLQSARELCDATGTLLMLDEIQSGGGRTGTFLASEASGVRGDIVTLAKPIAGGIPIGATLAREDVGNVLQPGTHGSTFGGGALACRAGLVFLEELYDHGLLERVTELGRALRTGLDRLVDKHAIAVSTRGRGLMQALVLTIDSAPLARGLLDRGLLVNAAGGNALRLLPPFVLSDAELAQGLHCIDEQLTHAEERS